MRKLCVALTLILLCATQLNLAQSGTTTVTAIVKDSAGCIYGNAPYNVSLVVPAQPSGAPQPFYTGTTTIVAPTVYVGNNTDSFGNLSIQLPDNNLITPSGTQWKFGVCAHSGLPCFTATITITGSSQSITTDLTAAAVPLSCTITPGNNVNWYRNNVLVGTEPGGDFAEGTGIHIVATDDGGASRVHYTLSTVSGGPVTPHNLLSTTHSDTNPSTPPGIGDMIRGSSSNLWEHFARGSSSQLLAMNPSGSNLEAWENFNFYNNSTTPINSVGRLGLNLIAGTNVTITPADDGTNNRVNYTIDATGGGTPTNPAPPEHAVQFNEPLNSFAGDANLIFNASMISGGTVGRAIFTGSGLNDATSGGTGSYGGTTDLTYCVKIDGTGTPDTFSWGTGGSCTNGGINVAITGGVQALSNGVTVIFGATTGHTLNDLWTIGGYIDRQPQLDIGDQVGGSLNVDFPLNSASINLTSTDGFFVGGENNPGAVLDITTAYRALDVMADNTNAAYGSAGNDTTAVNVNIHDNQGATAYGVNVDLHPDGGSNGIMAGVEIGLCNTTTNKYLYGIEVNQPLSAANESAGIRVGSGGTKITDYAIKLDGGRGTTPLWAVWGSTGAMAIGTSTLASLAAYTGVGKDVIAYCSDCATPVAQGDVCTGSGGGAEAHYIRGAWHCY